METVDIVVVIVLVLILGLSAGYIGRSKKSGKKCVGCPYADACSSKKSGCGCQMDSDS